MGSHNTAKLRVDMKIVFHWALYYNFMYLELSKEVGYEAHC